MATDTVARALAIAALSKGGGGGQQPKLFAPKVDTSTVLNEVSWVNDSDNGGFDVTVTATIDDEVETPLEITSALNGKTLKVVASAENFESAESTAELEYIDASDTYLTITSTTLPDCQLQTRTGTKLWNGTLEYSFDHETWTEWNGSTMISTDTSVIYLRGKGNTHITGNYSLTNGYFQLGGGNIEITGNIESLLNYVDVHAGRHPSMDAHCFKQLFRTTNIIKAPTLGATTLSINCYDQMFYDCKYLASAPIIAATTMANNSCIEMFRGCIRLTTAEDLAATTLATSCCNAMFYGCTALTKAPALPATTAAISCYQQMFYGCTSLVTPPALPATTLATDCYNGMFEGCTALTTITALPAITQQPTCYQSMFSGCSSLVVNSASSETTPYEFRIPTTGTGVTASNARRWMLNGTAGTVTGAPAIDTTYYVANEPISAAV